MSYLTWRSYARSGPVCFGALLVIAGAVLALLANQGNLLLGDNTMLIGAAAAILGLVFIIIGFARPKKKRDSVLTKVDTRSGNVPPPPPPKD